MGSGDRDPREVLALTREYGISARLTFSNSLLRPEHLSDPRCNRLCRLLAESPGPQNGVIVHSDLLLDHLRRTYPGLYFVSSTTKVLTDFSLLRRELERPEFRYVVADFRLNRAFRQLDTLPQALRDKTELLCNEVLRLRLPGPGRLLPVRQPGEPGPGGSRPPLHRPGRRRGLSLLPGHGEPRLHRRERYPGRLSPHGLFPVQDRGPQPGHRPCCWSSCCTI